jgi:hypothetical protein
LKRTSSVVIALVVSGLALPGIEASAEADQTQPTSEAPVAFAGVVPGVTEIDPESVKVQIQPDQQQLEAHRSGVSVDETDVPAAMVTTRGNAYTLRMDPTALPAADVSDTGIVTFDIYAQDPASPSYSVATVSVRAVITATGQYGWTDPLSGTFTIDADTSANDRVPPSARATYERADSRSARSITKYAPTIRAVRVRMAAPHVEDRVCNDEGCAPARNSTTSDRWQISSIDDETESGEFDQSSGFEWDPKGYARSFRVGISYRKVEGEGYYGRCPGDAPYWVKWEPHHYTGGYGENTDGVTRPDWDKCVTIGSTGIWWRSRSDGSSYSHSAGVKFASVIGIDLSSKRAYNSEAKTGYLLKVRFRRMCGNNDDAGIAGKVMERS